MTSTHRTWKGGTAARLLLTGFWLLAACGGGGGGGDGNNSGNAVGVGAGPPPPSASPPPPGASPPPPGEEFYAAPEKVTDALQFTSVAAGYHHTCAIAVDGDTYCWGYNEFGQLGSSAPMQTCVSGMFQCSSTPLRVDTNEKFMSLAASIRHTCGLTAAGDPYCWGFGLGGQLGDGARANSVAPVAVAGGLKFTTLAASIASGSTCGLTAAGDAWCWGVGHLLGIPATGAYESLPLPVVSAGSGWAALSRGFGQTCALKSDGELYCWGHLLALLSDTAETPTRIAGNQDFVAASAGGTHTCAIGADGFAYCFGLNNWGQIGRPPSDP